MEIRLPVLFEAANGIRRCTQEGQAAKDQYRDFVHRKEQTLTKSPACNLCGELVGRNRAF